MVTESLGPLLPAEGSGVLLALDSPDAQRPVTETGLPTGPPHRPATSMVMLSAGRPGARRGSPGAALPSSAPGTKVQLGLDVCARGSGGHKGSARKAAAEAVRPPPDTHQIEGSMEFCRTYVRSRNRKILLIMIWRVEKHLFTSLIKHPRLGLPNRDYSSSLQSN